MKMDNSLLQLRIEIDSIDEKIIKLIAKRMVVVQKVGIYKKKNGILPLDKTRWKQVIQSRKKMGEKYGLPKNLIDRIFESIHGLALLIEEKVKNG